MKLKCLPEDFQVTELADVPAGRGPFALYRLTKRSLGTPEAVTAILQRWKLPRHKISYGGLKDRHALTQQHLTIHHGPKRDLSQSGFELTYLGQTESPFTPRDIAANEFRIVLRDLAEQDVPRLQSAAAAVSQEGVPNYFDDQRFGSLGESGEFIAEPWCRGDYERALWLALAEPNPHDRPDERREKQILREHWNEWNACKELLNKSHRRSVVTFLVDHPTDFRRALALVRADLRSLSLAAFQSSLWNDILAAWLREQCRPDQLHNVELTIGSVPFYVDLDEAQRETLRSLSLPLPSARCYLEDSPLKPLYDRVLAERGLALRELRVKYPRDSFFSKGDRAAVVVPNRLRAEPGADELYSSRRKLTLSFTLPRGAYATIVVKRLTLGMGREVEERGRRSRGEGEIRR